MLNLIKKLPTGWRLYLRLRSLFEKKIIGGGLAFAFIATTIVPTSNLILPQEELDQSFKPASSIIQIGKTQIETKEGIHVPAQNIRLTQKYWAFHPGVDLAGPLGTSVTPIMAGVVSDIQYSRFAYGNAIIIDHGNGITSLYAHLSKILVVKDQEVEITTEIGKIGSTGHSTGPHLHLEIRENGLPVNPFSVISSLAKLPIKIIASSQR